MPELLIPDDAKLERRAAVLAEALIARGWSMAAAESCTGGWIAKVCTDRVGSSGWFERGVVTYSNRAKSHLLGVREENLQSDGAVSRAVALQMAEGVRERSGVDAALAVTGIAGPDGGTADKPVGTVWFAWAVGAAPAQAERVVFQGDRDAVRRQSVAHALQGLIDRLAQ